MGAVIEAWTALPVWLTLCAAVLLLFTIGWLLRMIVGKGMYQLAFRMGNRYLDLIVDRLKPFNFVLFLPLVAVWYFPWAIASDTSTVRKTLAVLMIWLGVDLAIRILECVNDINRHRKYYRGVSIAGYMDLLKVAVIIAAVVVTVRTYWDVSNEMLLGGIGAWLAVIMLVFKDTLLSFVASIHITTQDLIKEGDWIEVPSLGIDGNVTEIDLHTIKVRNFDNTISPIATHKIQDLSYRNWRGMQESGGRRMVFTIPVDQHSVRMVNGSLIERLRNEAYYSDALSDELEALQETGNRVTNIQLYLWFAKHYLKNRNDLHQRRLTLIARLKEPTPQGLPVQIYAYTRTVDWIEHEEIKAEILSHLMAALAVFDLFVFQDLSNSQRLHEVIANDS